MNEICPRENDTGDDWIMSEWRVKESQKRRVKETVNGLEFGEHVEEDEGSQPDTPKRLYRPNSITYTSYTLARLGQWSTNKLPTKSYRDSSLGHYKVCPGRLTKSGEKESRSSIGYEYWCIFSSSVRVAPSSVAPPNRVAYSVSAAEYAKTDLFSLR